MDTDCDFFTDRLWFVDGHPSRTYYTPVGKAAPQPPGVVQLTTGAPASPVACPFTQNATPPSTPPAVSDPHLATLLQSVLENDEMWDDSLTAEMDAILADLGSPTMSGPVMSELQRVVNDDNPMSPQQLESTGVQALGHAGVLVHDRTGRDGMCAAESSRVMQNHSNLLARRVRMHQINTCLSGVRKLLVEELHINGGGLLYSIWSDLHISDVGLRPSDHPQSDEDFFKAQEDRWCDLLGLCRWTIPEQNDAAQQLLQVGMSHLESFVFHRQEHPGAPPSTHWPLDPM